MYHHIVFLMNKYISEVTDQQSIQAFTGHPSTHQISKSICFVKQIMLDYVF